MPSTVSFYTSPLTFASATVGGAGAIAYTVNSGAYAYPRANTRTMIIYNSGANPLLVGNLPAAAAAALPAGAFPNGFTAFGGAGGAPVPVAGGNCTIVPAASALTLDLGTYEERGNMDPEQIPFSVCSLFFFSATGGATTAVITYKNVLGRF
jgi:hypothetical protein